MGNFATASRRESDPFPQPGLGAYKGTLWDPAAKIAPGQVARNSNLKFGVRPSTLAIKQPMRIKTPTKANINAAPPSSTVRVVPYPVRAVKALGRRYLSRAACEKTADVCGSPRRLRVVGILANSSPGSPDGSCPAAREVVTHGRPAHRRQWRQSAKVACVFSA